jgi:hypothetical protein
MNERPTTIETERLLVVTLMPEEIESLIVGDAEHVALVTGFTILQDDPNRGVDLPWHLRSLQVVAGRSQPDPVANSCDRRACLQLCRRVNQLKRPSQTGGVSEVAPIMNRDVGLHRLYLGPAAVKAVHPAIFLGLPFEDSRDTHHD